jgi:hypothetical protein
VQYLLTEEEYRALVPATEFERSRDCHRAAVVLLIGDRCIHTNRGMEYCDNCPISNHQLRKSGSELRGVCHLGQNYGK